MFSAAEKKASQRGASAPFLSLSLTSPFYLALCLSCPITLPSVKRTRKDTTTTIFPGAEI